MRTLNAWLDDYSESHRNVTNKTIHWICVPIIYFCVFGLLYSVSPIAAWIALAGTIAFYFPISITLALGMLVLSLMMLGVISVIPHIRIVSAVLFIFAWIGQFYGHKVEGKKPSFFKDLQFLLIGPIWLLNFVYQKIGIKA